MTGVTVETCFVNLKVSFVCIWMKTNFHDKNFGLSLAFIMRFKAARKWSIVHSWHWPATLIIRQRMSEIRVEESNGTAIFGDKISENWVYLARLRSRSGNRNNRKLPLHSSIPTRAQFRWLGWFCYFGLLCRKLVNGAGLFSRRFNWKILMHSTPYWNRNVWPNGKPRKVLNPPPSLPRPADE